ncbi:DNA-deoxyinosine glycosylase [Trinickia violacea]|uniref:DNA-deoxyinosine glycosylase n=1 Tax=Trinickia violacea TaxID=2571746 RepID=A0A4P8IKD1_9BURK|nr:DNA-deoxyinosine glycosylase [Trinickia violacea]QCP48686.1 DNA-deoxyinosine glycosylase [Trinickia violacea]
MTLKRCFPPVVDRNTRVLVLGSLPGEVSLAQNQYYAHKQNRFWHLMGDVIGEPLPSMGYEARLQALLDHRVGLWDVIAKARREGSLDSRIRDHAANDLAALVAALPNLAAVVFNGGTAAKIGMQALADSRISLDLIKLPSSSPAYAAVPYAEKLRAWEALRKWLAA